MSATCKNPILNKKSGFTLIELMISMTLGIGLLGGLMAMYLSGEETDRARIELNDIDANAFSALKKLRDTIQHAGYGTVAVEALQKSFYTEDDGDLTDNPLCRDGKNMIVSGLEGNAGLLNPPTELSGYTKDGNDGDIVTVVYRPDSPDKGYYFTDCAGGDYSTGSSTEAANKARMVACSTDTTVKTSFGMPQAKDSKIYSGFFLRQKSGSSKQLVCYGSRSEDIEPYVIADNVENMQIRYAVKQNDSTVYKKADDISETEWTSVTSVEVALLVGSSNTQALVTPADRTFQLLDHSVSKPASDRRMYKVYSTTIYLHNVGMR